VNYKDKQSECYDTVLTAYIIDAFNKINIRAYLKVNFVMTSIATGMCWRAFWFSTLAMMNIWFLFCLLMASVHPELDSNVNDFTICIRAV